MELTIDTSIPVNFELVEDDDPRFQKATIYLAHVGLSKKKTYFDKKILEKTMESLKNIPVLGFIELNNFNEADFQGHEERLIVKQTNGTTEIDVVYVGKCLGTIPETNNARFEMRICDDGIEREFVVVDCLLYKRYKEVLDIFEASDGVKKHSLEIEPSTVKGYFDKDKVFHFTDFLYEGACIIGDSKITGMWNSSIETYTVNSFQSEIDAMNTEVAEYQHTQFTFEGGENLKNEKDKNKGGIPLELSEQKNELILQYTTLTDEDLTEVKSSIDQFSLEDLEIKLKELSDAKFALTYNQLESEIRKELGKYVEEIDDYGYKYKTQIFYFSDIKDNLVICRHTNWTDYYGVPFSQNNDSITLDYDAKIPYMADWRPKVEGDMVSEFTAEDVKSRMDAFAESVKSSQFSADTSESTPIPVTESEEYKSLVSEFELSKADHIVILDKFTLLTQENETLKSLSEEFTNYRLSKETSEKEDLVNSTKFALLTEDDKKVFLDELDKFTITDLENQLYMVLGKKASQYNFTANGNIPKDLSFNFDNPNPEVKTEKGYASIIREKNASKSK